MIDLWNLAQSDHWYDLAVRAGNAEMFEQRLAGRAFTGRPGRTDPGIDKMVL